MPIFVLLLEAGLLVVALSVDAFIASFSYGVNSIKIPMLSCLLIDFVCSGTLLLAMLFGTALGAVLPKQWIHIICFGILFLLGIAKLFDSMIKAWISKHKHASKQLSFHVFSFHMILQIYADATEADTDCSRILSPYEAIGLAVALSFDSIAAGFGAGLHTNGIWITFALALVTGFLAVFLGERLGKKLSKMIKQDISWISGALLIILAICKW